MELSEASEIEIGSAPFAIEEALAQGVKAGFSEDVLAQLFVASHSSGLSRPRLLYCHTSGQWYQWNGFIWERDLRRRAFDFARRICRLHGEGAKFHKASVADGVEKFAKADPRVARDAASWDVDPLLLGTPDGTVDLRTGKLLPADPNYMITRSANVAPAPGRAERWLKFLYEATAGDEELISFLQRVMGYCLTGLTHEHALFFVHGPGGNGKSVFLNTLTRILGTYAQTAMMDTFIATRGDRHSTDLASLAGARLVTASETEQGRHWDEPRIKQLTGGDPITARFMRKDPFTFKPALKLMIVGNHEPMLRNVDPAMRRRFNIVPFRHSPPERDPHLEMALDQEHPQILQWMIEGSILWQRGGLQQPAAVIQSTESYFEQQDLIGQWIEAQCELDASHFASAAQLYESYEKFARHAGEHPMKQKGFGSALALRPGVHQQRSCGVRGYLGLRLISEQGMKHSPDEDEELRRP